MPDNQEQRNTLLTKFIVGIVIAWLVMPWIIIGLFSLLTDDLQLTPGTFGDVFGSVNALFAGLAFAGLLWTILLQQSAMRMQQSEIKIQREMLQAQLDEQREARKSMDAQANAQHKMITAINALTSATSIQAQINKQTALLQITYDQIRDEQSSGTTIGQMKSKKLLEQATPIKESLNKLSNMAAQIDPNMGPKRH